MALKLEAPERLDAAVGIQRAERVAVEEGRHGRGGPIEEDRHVGVAGGPRILEQRGRPGLVERVHAVAQPIERLAQGTPPALIPAVVGARPGTRNRPASARRRARSSTMTRPRPAPRRGRMRREERGVARERRGAAGLDPGAGRGQRHLAEAMVMAVGLAVGRDMDELRVRARVSSKPARRRVASASPDRRSPLEGDGVGDRSVVEEERELDGPAPVPPVGPAGIEPGSGTRPVAAELAHAGGLGRRRR